MKKKKNKPQEGGNGSLKSEHGYHFTIIRMATIKKKRKEGRKEGRKSTSVDKDVEKLEHLYIADRNAKRHRCYGKQ